mmetsp:Transcript_36258/g.66983  ORF Transcript_36258/g.66983 Transcript_36258/m.66983 type:complete len:150 (-) Transcript_36258:347-796(-)
MADVKQVPMGKKENVKENDDMDKDMKQMTLRESQRIEDPILDEPWCCYRDKEGELSWSGLTCKVWGIVTAIFVGAYVVLGLFMAGLLAAHVEGGLTVLWAYFAAFVAFVLGLIVVVVLGECHRAKAAKEEIVEDVRPGGELQKEVEVKN